MIIASQMPPTVKDPAVVQVVPGQPGYLTVGMAKIDEPPPYVQNQYQPVQPVVRRPVPPVPARPRPSTSAISLRTKYEIPATNHLFFKTRHEPINGTFYIDPELQIVALDRTGATAVDRRDIVRKHRQKHRHHCRKNIRKKRSDLPDPNAIFETRQGAITLDLGIVAHPNAAHSRTLIQAATRQGPVDIKVRGIDPRRGLNMEVSSRKGDICILIPRSFSGYIQIYSRHGQLIFLPHLRHSMTLVSRNEREVQVVVGDAAHSLPTGGTEWRGDTMHVATKHGDVFIGYVGEDSKPMEEPGFWKKVADFFQTKN